MASSPEETEHLHQRLYGRRRCSEVQSETKCGNVAIGSAPAALWLASARRSGACIG